MLLIDKGMPYKPIARISREALNAARMARIHWDGSQTAMQAELQLLSQDAAARTAVQSSDERVDDEQLEQTREAGVLKGQVEQLQNQAREAIEREKTLRAQLVQ